MHNVYIGTSGYVYRDWRGVFYPETLAQRKWLHFYSEQFQTVEINATFYGSFKPETFHKWRNEVGRNFAFTIKGTRYVTHVKRLKEVEDSVERFFESASGLEDCLSCVLWQFPKNFRATEETMTRLEAFLKLLPANIRQAIEFRHESWFTEKIFTLLDHYRAGFVINDSAAFPACEKITGDFAYIRSHGPGQLYASKYTEKQMADWAEKIKEYRKTHDVYCYFNNDYFGYAIENAQELLCRIKK
jgi:uncharacterized protein YecE (DUF72 family)